MLVPSTRSVFPILALDELLSAQQTIAIEAFAAVKIKSVMVIETGEDMASDRSVVERGPSVGAVASNLITRAIVCGHDNAFVGFALLVCFDHTERCGVVEFEQAQ
jgi:hypothetical protein